MEIAEVKRIIEALLFVFGEPIALKRLGEIIPDADATQIRQAVHTLNDEYQTAAHAFHIQEVAGG